jgi:hypothetical protein
LTRDINDGAGAGGNVSSCYDDAVVDAVLQRLYKVEIRLAMIT